MSGSHLNGPSIDFPASDNAEMPRGGIVFVTFAGEKARQRKKEREREREDPLMKMQIAGNKSSVGARFENAGIRLALLSLRARGALLISASRIKASVGRDESS
jgi:hypothetical protein